MTQPRVFIVQDQKIKREGKLIHKYDFTPAQVFGELVFVLPSDARPYHSTSCVAKIHETLRGITQKDFVLLVGNPVLIGWTMSIAAYYLNGKLRCLQWEQTKQSYIPISAELYDGI